MDNAVKGEDHFITNKKKITVWTRSGSHDEQESSKETGNNGISLSGNHARKWLTEGALGKANIDGNSNYEKTWNIHLRSSGFFDNYLYVNEDEEEMTGAITNIQWQKGWRLKDKKNQLWVHSNPDVVKVKPSTEPHNIGLTGMNLISDFRANVEKVVYLDEAGSGKAKKKNK